jgi:hypothetical protein
MYSVGVELDATVKEPMTAAFSPDHQAPMIDWSKWDAQLELN